MRCNFNKTGLALSKIFPYILTLIFFFGNAFQTSARHIIGGEITYVCTGAGDQIGTNNYTFTMNVYRDCFGGGANFDNPAIITIYRGDNLMYEQHISNLAVNHSNPIEAVPPPDNPCLIPPPGICVQKATYVFTVNLPVSNHSYHIVYQRCCRNETISNIVNPGNAGATYTMELTALAQQLCNASPVFNDFPPILICANEALEFDHSASDADGDQLVYKFCSPILGGGLLGTPEAPGDPTGCNGVTPNPACPPPYGEVTFVNPLYSADQPMGGNPLISIDENTGIISGTPIIQGQFVVGVCVEERRNGQLLSRTRRDFQFNVVTCTPTVDAMIDYDELIGDDQYVINSCGDFDVTFTNLSIQQQFINEYYWTFDLGGSIETFDEWEPTITFPELGTYSGDLVLNPGTVCADTAFIFVNVYPAIYADFSFEYDTCVAGPVDLTDLSYSDAGPGTITDWDWTFATQGNSTEQHPSFQFMQPGNLPISLTVTDINNCQDTETQPIEWFPVPALVLIEPSTFDGCEPQEVFFDNLSFPIDTTYDIVWDLGDGTISNEISPAHIYEEAGIYSISVQITSPIGCYTDAYWENWIRVRPSPTAGFSYSPDEITSFDPTTYFHDESIEAFSWFWDFDGDGISMESDPVFSFPDTGLQVVTQIVTHASGCTDTLVRIIDVVPKVTYFLPNAFTPNFDNLNDIFVGKGYFDGIENFRMTIWNRWGELIFETNNPNEGWNGRKNNVGVPSPNGVYVCVVTYSGPRGGNFEIKTFATLIK